ncbi:MAG TPA: alkyl sulfatase dimerization domain-containing protein [Acidimicrobiia bacterium]|jgi:alkyl sulfatase BDS1-like metallo-beta-lactamase superfamily hydrolase
MSDVLQVAERLFTGELDIASHHPFQLFGDLAELENGAFVAAFSNASALRTDEGLVLVDTSSTFLSERVHDAIRSWTREPVHTIVFTHGHIDHCFGVERYEEDARADGHGPPRVVAHEAITARFERYVTTAGYNGIINARQFQASRVDWPTTYRYPDETYRDALTLDIGGETFELQHARGETDDHTWLWAPARRTVCTGDLFIWASPNCGNPQKVQRYPLEWARALRTMAALDPEVLLPGHGLPILGTERVQQALNDAAALLESLHDQTLELMNQGARLDDIVHTVRAPDELLARPYLRPIYDEPEFVVHNVWRYYGGWYDGNPARLKPAPDAAVAREVAALAGGAARLAARARELAAAGELRLAGHLAEWAAAADPSDPETHRARAEVYGARAEAEASTMSKGIFSWAARESSAQAGAPASPPIRGDAG